jgi:hypothetical protein
MRRNHTIEITTEVRAAIDRAAGDIELAGSEYIEPADGLIHCKKCRGSRQTLPTQEFTGRDSKMRWLPGCKIRRFMVVWRYENGRESRWED